MVVQMGVMLDGEVSGEGVPRVPGNRPNKLSENGK